MHGTAAVRRVWRNGVNGVALNIPRYVMSALIGKTHDPVWSLLRSGDLIVVAVFDEGDDHGGVDVTIKPPWLSVITTLSTRVGSRPNGGIHKYAK